MSDQPRIVEYMVCAYRASDQRYFYGREAITEAMADSIPAGVLDRFMFESITRDVLAYEDETYGKVGNDAEWFGETAVRLIPDLDGFLDS